MFYGITIIFRFISFENVLKAKKERLQQTAFGGSKLLLAVYVSAAFVAEV